MSQYRIVQYKYVLLIALVTFVMSMAAMPIYNAGVAAWDRQQLYEEMRTNPHYDIRNEIEMKHPYITVLAVTDNGEAVVVWVLFDATGVAETEFYSAIADCALALHTRYMSNAYGVMLTRVNTIPSLEGPITYLTGTTVFLFNPAGMRALTDVECTVCLLNKLYATGNFQPVGMTQTVYCSALLQREPGYTWPWE